MSACEPCAYVKAHGWYGPGHRGAHCHVCHASWTGLAIVHCVVCHETFSTNGTADLHWRWAVHLDPRTVSGLRRAENGIWRQAGSRPAHWLEAS